MINEYASASSMICSQKIERDEASLLGFEAEAIRAKSKRVDLNRIYLDSNNCLHGITRSRVGPPGRNLLAFQQSSGLSIAHAFSGEQTIKIMPTRACYLFYSPGDCALLHHDSVHASITLLVPLFGSGEPLSMYPYLGNISTHDLEALVKNMKDTRSAFEERNADYFGACIESFEVPFEPERAVAIRGANIAHSRFRADECSVIAAMCFSLLFPSAAWLPPSI